MSFVAIFRMIYFISYNCKYILKYWQTLELRIYNSLITEFIISLKFFEMPVTRLPWKKATDCVERQGRIVRYTSVLKVLVSISNHSNYYLLVYKYS